VTGLRDLDALLAAMEPKLLPADYVFCTVTNAALPDLSAIDPIGVFREAEGTSLILERKDAERLGLACSAPMRLITLTVHSSLEAVGLTAAVASALAEAGISANVVAAYHHDHIFVPAANAERALATLTALSESSRTRG